jgi:hypothetical protein
MRESDHVHPGAKPEGNTHTRYKLKLVYNKEAQTFQWDTVLQTNFMVQGLPWKTDWYLAGKEIP